MNKKIFLGFIGFSLIFLNFLLSSCKVPQKVSTQPLKEQGPDYLFTQLKKNELNFKTLSARFTADAVVDKENRSFTGNIYIVRDSLIWLSISKFGIEVARFFITVDSAKMINRVNNTYFIGDFSYVASLFRVDFDFDILQSLIVGNDLSYYDNDVFKASVDNKHYKLSTIGRRKLKKYIRKANEEHRVLIQDIWLDPETFKIVKISMKEVKQENRKFEATYSDFQTGLGQSYSHRRKYEISDEKRIEVNIQFTRVSFERNETLSFKIPAGYTRIYR